MFTELKGKLQNQMWKSWEPEQVWDPCSRSNEQSFKSLQQSFSFFATTGLKNQTPGQECPQTYVGSAAFSLDFRVPVWQLHKDCSQKRKRNSPKSYPGKKNGIWVDKNPTDAIYSTFDQAASLLQTLLSLLNPA